MGTLQQPCRIVFTGGGEMAAAAAAAAVDNETAGVASDCEKAAAASYGQQEQSMHRPAPMSRHHHLDALRAQGS